MTGEKLSKWRKAATGQEFKYQSVSFHCELRPSPSPPWVFSSLPHRMAMTVAGPTGPLEVPVKSWRLDSLLNFLKAQLHRLREARFLALGLQDLKTPFLFFLILEFSFRNGFEGERNKTPAL